ncbi:MAG: ATPase [Pelagibacteraceae bacterium TMED216]|nr:MAG: ATPase [Pelagibacteraceae bacterium TMED216]|tara:strand:+ start:42 stop:536 length:495 start_codon:yes stop_codon:yes gene_type:complete
MIDATFWVAVSFFIFIGLLVYFKIPLKIKKILDENILEIKKQIEEAEKLRTEARNILGEHEDKLINSKKEIKKMIEKANDNVEKEMLKTNQEFHNLMELRKRNAEMRINQMKQQAVREIKNVSVSIAISSVKRLLKNSMDKSKLDKIYLKSVEETKLALNKKSS